MFYVCVIVCLVCVCVCPCSVCVAWFSCVVFVFCRCCVVCVCLGALYFGIWYVASWFDSGPFFVLGLVVVVCNVCVYACLVVLCTLLVLGSGCLVFALLRLLCCVSLSCVLCCVC